MSELETTAIADLIEQIAPTVTVWVHQPLGYVSSVGPSSDAYEQAWARGAGIRIRPDVTQHGGGESWTTMAKHVPSLLVEVDGWDATPEIVAAHRNGFAELLTLFG